VHVGATTDDTGDYTRRTTGAPVRPRGQPSSMAKRARMGDNWGLNGTLPRPSLDDGQNRVAA
jgi:hypothetical protein